MKTRLDVLLVSQGFSESREKAKAVIMAGEVFVNGQREDKAGSMFDEKAKIEVRGQKLPYVSRGGFKLEKALKVFDISVKDKTVLDIGSSTGGFTDVMLQNGAKLSYALDVGTNQLVWQLREDPRVVVMEQTNFRYSKLADFTSGQPEFASIDVSFISLRLILPPLAQILKMGGEVVALIKPQFEAGKEHVGKNGIIHDHKVHRAVLEEVLTFAREDHFDILGLDYSPIKGGQGNMEFLVHLRLSENPGIVAEEVNIDKVIAAADDDLNHKE